jgi:TonB family protein
MRMRASKRSRVLAAAFSLAIHAAVFALASSFQFGGHSTPKVPPESQVVFLQVLPPPQEKVRPKAQELSPVADPLPQKTTAITEATDPLDKTQPAKEPATMVAPSAPTADEWAFAAKYTNKNSKGYRHSWGQQVRSMMGTAVEGPDQGEVRFRIEIAPNGTLAQLDTLWSTSALAEKLARQAIQNMPPLPPTPTGKPLIFEKTISFSPFASDGPPTYKDDCLPDTPAFKNPFAWDGKSAQVRTQPPPQALKLDEQAMEECLRQLPKDSLEAEMARDQRLMDQWGSSKTGR